MDKAQCSVPGCEREHSAKGYCMLHYTRWRRHGDPNQARRMMPRSATLRERIEALREQGDPNSCWNWKGTIHYSGYGHMQVNGVQKSAHVWAYMDAYGPIPEGLFVLHSCDNRRCVNPNHLRVGTHQENMDDKVKRDRCSRLRGQDAPSRKLLETEAVEIIRRYFTEKTSSSRLAKEYGISPSEVQNIVNGKRWPHLNRSEILKGIA